MNLSICGFFYQVLTLSSRMDFDYFHSLLIFSVGTEYQNSQKENKLTLILPAIGIQVMVSLELAHSSMNT